MKFITRETFGPVTDWSVFTKAIDAGHALPKAEVEDVFLGPPGNTLLSRAAHIKGIGFGVKSVTVIAENTQRDLPSVQGGMIVFDEQTGTPTALIDSALITDIKTAADSVLGARYLARPDAKHMVVLGAGSVAGNVIAAYRQMFPDIERFTLWNRTHAKAQALAETLQSKGLPVSVTRDVSEAVSNADIVTCATMSIDPVLKGKWLRPGTHVDLIGAFRADMREADDDVLTRGQIYVDSRDTTLAHIGELKIPLDTGVITTADILADLYQLKATGPKDRHPDSITVFKNGGGAHLDLMIANAILQLKAE
ncbi:ornithine cyclodeaminase [Amylibacter marinus]|uniref:Ornithine cyclodeaminase n=1 Tax=Amylibacter marinus TaxID=1475483 RepID=A0ABQ5VY51_9RHOB|nr:ornithine cyclodeaminase [Amylibacter marinus]GLQ36190.1 ornithine cyclodeaminase [Amylibacter marinus]